MKPLTLILSAALFGSAWTGGSPANLAQGDQAEVALQAAMKKEAVDGDLKGAIEAYKKIVQSRNRAVAAKALVRMGQCYEKLGDTEARKAYERVLREFADQKESVEQARTHLAAKGRSETGMVARRVWAGQDVDLSGTPSPDGRYLTFADWETGDLAVRNLAAGEKRRLTNKGPWFESIEYAKTSTVSPDGSQVAYGWQNNRGFDELRILPFGAVAEVVKARVLYLHDDVRRIYPLDWSPDGKQILALFQRKDKTNQIVLVAAADGSVRVLKSLDWRAPHKMSFSPDGRYVVYDFPPKADSSKRDIFLLGIDRGQEIPLVRHAANDHLPVWSPDGKKVLFASDRTGNTGVWAVTVVEGKAQGSPELLKPDAGRMVPLGFTRKGAYYYGLQTGMKDVFIATLDPLTGKVVGAPAPVSESFVGANATPDWSPDGRSLSYLSRRSPTFAEPGSRPLDTLVIRSVETGEERELSPQIRTPEANSRPRWTPDGRSLLIAATDDQGRQGIFRIDAQTGATAPVVLAPPQTYLRQGVLSPDGRSLFYVRSGETVGFRGVARDLASGQERELAFRGGNLTISPDGRWLSFVLTEEGGVTNLKVVSTAGGEPRVVLQVQRPDLIQGFANVAWAPDSRSLYFVKSHGITQEKNELWRVPLEGGEAQSVGLAVDRMGELRVHPDGRRIAFSAGQAKAEVWVMDNLLPVLKASR